VGGGGGGGGGGVVGGWVGGGEGGGGGWGGGGGGGRGGGVGGGGGGVGGGWGGVGGGGVGGGGGGGGWGGGGGGCFFGSSTYVISRRGEKTGTKQAVRLAEILGPGKEVCKVKTWSLTTGRATEFDAQTPKAIDFLPVAEARAPGTGPGEVRPERGGPGGDRRPGVRSQLAAGKRRGDRPGAQARLPAIAPSRPVLTRSPVPAIRPDNEPRGPRARPPSSRSPQLNQAGFDRRGVACRSTTSSGHSPTLLPPPKGWCLAQITQRTPRMEDSATGFVMCLSAKPVRSA